MSAQMDVQERLSALQPGQPSLRLFALVDGAAYQVRRGRALRSAAGVQSLFKGTPDAALARTGPWLVDAEAAGPGLTQDLALLEARAPALCWCLAATDLA
jgi:hypothetical protein